MTTFNEYAARIVESGEFSYKNDSREIQLVLQNRSMRRLMLKLGMMADGAKEQLARVDFAKADATLKAVQLQARYQGMMLMLDEILAASEPPNVELDDQQVQGNGEDRRMKLTIGDMTNA